MSNIANSTVPIQIESLQTGGPTSESALIAMGGAINYSLANKPAVGDIMLSALDETTFQAQRDTTWKLCDGRNVGGSQYQVLTSQANIPDFRGVFPRGKDNGRGINPNGDLAIGAQTGDQVGSHTHPTVRATNAGVLVTDDGSSPGGGNWVVPGTKLAGHAFTIDAAGGPETAPKSTTTNFFIKINI